MSRILSLSLAYFGTTDTSLTLNDRQSRNGMVSLVTILTEFAIGNYFGTSGLLGTAICGLSYYSTYMSIIHFYSLLRENLLHAPSQLSDDALLRSKHIIESYISSLWLKPPNNIK